MDNFVDMITQAISQVPDVFSADELRYVSKLTLGINAAKQTSGMFFDGRDYINAQDYITATNATYTDVITGVSRENLFLTLMKALELLGRSLSSRAAPLAVIPNGLTALVATCLSLNDVKDTSSGSYLLYGLRDYIQIRLGALPPLSWIPDNTMCYLVTQLISNRYMFDGRVASELDEVTKYYSINREALVKKFSSPDNTASSTERVGVIEIFHSYKNNSMRAIDATALAAIISVADGSVVTEIPNKSYHCVGILYAEIINALPYRMACNIQSTDSTNVSYLPEGETKTDIDANTSAISTGDKWYFAADSITLNKGDTATITSIPQFMLTSIIKDNKRWPDIKYYSTPII